MASAREEISHVLEFEYIIVNERFDSALDDLIAIVRATRTSRVQQSHRLSKLINEFR
jgi:guanylate kinase